MEKLIMLLDIYEEEVVWVHSVWDKITEKDESWICSKKFGFIKWLVDNNRIDTTNKFLVSVNVENTKNWMGYTKAFENYEAILMLLAIQDEPIEFLCSILK